MTIKYEADAHISIQTEIMVPENATDDDILLESCSISWIVTTLW